MSRLPFLAQRLFNRPLLIEPRKAELVLGALADRVGLARVVVLDESGGRRTLSADQLKAETVALVDTSQPRERKVFDLRGGVAIIPIEGTLVSKLGLDPWSGMTGYDGIREKIFRAAEDDEVQATWLDVDTPGGEVADLFDLVDEIQALRQSSGGPKPIWAVLSDTAFSAGYAIASAADRIIIPRTGMLGSVGVVMMHVDFSRMLAEDGVTVTFIHWGAHKVDGNQFEPLSEAVMADLQAEVDEVGQLFAATVDRNRGLAAGAAAATEARTYLGPRAVELGLADDVMSGTEAWLALQAELEGAAAA